MSAEAEARLLEIETGLLAKCAARPGLRQVERVYTMALSVERGVNAVPHKFFTVTAVYPFQDEQLILYGHPEYVKHPFVVKGFSYMLFDVDRDPWSQAVQMSREGAVKLLDGVDPPALPQPATWGDDPFKGLVE